MGGCRCSFRQCPVASERNKGMHFFKFPVRQPERLNRWVQLAGVEHFLKLREPPELCFKVICARHFHANHFMNYKNNRLTISATPTLHRLNKEYALDYSISVDQPALIKLPEITRPHLIPPEGFPDTMVFTAADQKFADKIIASFQQDPVPQIVDVVNQTKRKQSNTVQNVTLKKRKLIKKAHQDDNCAISIEENDSGQSDIELTYNGDDTNLQTTVLETVNIDKVKILRSGSKKITSNNTPGDLLNKIGRAVKDEPLQKVEEHLSDELICSEIMKSELLKSQETNFSLNAQLKELNVESENLKIELATQKQQKEDLNKQLKSVVLAYRTLQKENGDLKKQLNEMEKQHKEHLSMPQLQIQSQQQPQLTKAQLFNGIKKYLSQTMVALLRIQLSSGTLEREWKPDERRLAVDVMQLGEHVYKYFTDEWLIRLPPLRQAQVWKTEIGAVEEEEDI